MTFRARLLAGAAFTPRMLYGMPSPPRAKSPRLTWASFDDYAPAFMLDWSPVSSATGYSVYSGPPPSI